MFQKTSRNLGNLETWDDLQVISNQIFTNDSSMTGIRPATFVLSDEVLHEVMQSKAMGPVSSFEATLESFDRLFFVWKMLHKNGELVSIEN